jgi:hypothetical protein
MTLRQKLLYHQIHSIKLLTDASAFIVSVYLLWQHRLALGLAIALLPPLVVSVILIRYADLSHLETSPLGRYVARHMTRRLEFARLAGALIAGVGAWYHAPALLVAGVAVIAAAWGTGLVHRS